jgi:ribonucleotide monophosphatase NagD (HAD superfamily)
MIGDNPKADIFGAKQLGATTFQKVHNNIKIGKDDSQPDFVFNEYHKFLKEIKNIFREKIS